METKVTLFELIISCGGLIATVVSAWIHSQIKVSTIKTELDYLKKELEAEKTDNKAQFIALNAKIDSIFQILTEIKVSVATHEKK